LFLEKMIGEKTMLKNEQSNCCGEEIIFHDICSKCGEHV
tara:strand:- start:448 stop:564 length:117 start_codon:yes stop_codon:yes gene_type:complete